MTQTVAIVGSGIGGIRTAQALRSLGYAGQLIVVGRETERPYDRPPLSKDFLAGRRDAEAVSLLSHQEAAEAGISLRLGVPAERIVPQEKCLVLGNGEILPYDICVVATGASARLSAWNKLDGVHVLRSMADSQALREQLLQRREVAVIGGGSPGSRGGPVVLVGCAGGVRRVSCGFPPQLLARLDPAVPFWYALLSCWAGTTACRTDRTDGSLQASTREISAARMSGQRSVI